MLQMKMAGVRSRRTSLGNHTKNRGTVSNELRNRNFWFVCFACKQLSGSTLGRDLVALAS